MVLNKWGSKVYKNVNEFVCVQEHVVSCGYARECLKHILVVAV